MSHIFDKNGEYTSWALKIGRRTVGNRCTLMYNCTAKVYIVHDGQIGDMPAFKKFAEAKIYYKQKEKEHDIERNND